MTDTYICSACGGTFEKITSEEEVVAECEELFDTEPDDPNMCIVCHDCWLKVMRIHAPRQLERYLNENN